jgi:two-component system OmpR family response regulator
MRILVAEDDAPLAEFLHQRLEQEQFAVQVVSNGAEAEQLASNQAYDLVILDLNLPLARELDVLRGIRSKRPDLPVVIVTGANMVEERVRGLDAGADDYVAKPFAFAELAARIRAVLRRAAGPRARFSGSKTSKSTASATRCAAEVTTSISARKSSLCSNS